MLLNSYENYLISFLTSLSGSKIMVKTWLKYKKQLLNENYKKVL